MFVTAVMMALSVVTLQRCFDEGDQKKAYQMVTSFPVPGGTVQQALLANSNGGATYCSPPEIVSSCAGTLNVECFAGSTGPYRFSVDLIRKSVTPVNEAARHLALVSPDGGTGVDGDG
jgi:hypothetical protein